MPRIRPSDLALGVVYFVAASVMIVTTRFDNGVAFLWIATSILVPVLLLRPRSEWPAPLAMCGIGSFFATGLFGLGWVLAGPLMVANLAEAVIAALLIARRGQMTAYFDSLQNLVRFVSVAGIIAPLAASLIAAVAVLPAQPDFTQTALNFFIGHALGAITFIPIAGLLISGDFVRTVRHSPPRKMLETAFALALVAVTVFVTFRFDRLPLLFLPAGPMIFAIFRARQIGAAMSIVLFAIIGGVLTAEGYGPIQLTDLSPGAKMQFFQFCLAAYVLGVLPIAADLKNRSRLHRELRLSRNRYQMLAEHSSDILLHLDVDGRILYASPAIEQIGGHDSEALVGRMSADLIHPDDVERVRDEHRAALRDGDRVRAFDYRGLTSAGDFRWFETRTRAVRNRDGVVEGVLSVIRDISARKETEGHLLADARTDPLTGLANRRAFAEAAARMMGDHRLKALSVALIDLDHFKSVNDRFGHEVGDEVLRSFARITADLVRSQDLVARLGGEEFAILLPDIGPLAAEAVCERLRSEIETSRFKAAGGPLVLTISGGISPIGECGLDAAMKRADQALYRAKESGRNRFVTAS